MSDDAIKGGSGDNDVAALYELETFKGRTNTDLLEAEWGADYEGIYRANVVLESTRNRNGSCTQSTHPW